MVPMVRFLSRLACIAAVSAFLWACDKPPEEPEVEAIDAADEPIRDFLRTAAATSQNSSNYAAAVNYYRSLHGRDSNDIDAILGLARNLRYIGSVNEATKLLKDALDQYPDRIDLRAELGKAQIAMGNAKDAVRHLQSAREKDSGNWDVFGTLGVGFDLLKSYGKAQEAYSKALTLSPGNLSVLNNMAISLALSGKLDAAISTLEDAPISIRRMPQVRQNLALFYALKGDLKKAGVLAKMDLSEVDARNNLAVFNRLRRQQTGPAKAK